MKNGQEIQLAFEVSASVHQTVVITNNNWTESALIKSLQDGTVVTTTWHEQGVDNAGTKDLSIETVSGDIIGYVRSQQIDGDYTNFR